jgi:alpha-mannosidase
VRDNVLRLTLLRGPKDLDETSEQGEHSFTYALLPHAGDWRLETCQRAAELNAPVIARWMDPNGAPDQPPQQSLIRVNRRNVFVDAVKAAEDGDGYILRVHEGCGCRGPVTLSFVAEVTGATEVDLLERPIRTHDVHGRRLTFDIRPYELKTFRVRLD